jgi:hypothetical protein
MAQAPALDDAQRDEDADDGQQDDGHRRRRPDASDSICPKT